MFNLARKVGRLIAKTAAVFGLFPFSRAKVVKIADFPISLSPLGLSPSGRAAQNILWRWELLTLECLTAALVTRAAGYEGILIAHRDMGKPVYCNNFYKVNIRSC